MNLRFFDWVEIAIFALIAGVAWQVILLVESGKVGEFGDPIATLYFWSGWTGVFCLMISLVSPRFKKQFGFFALIAAVLHSCVFVSLDFGYHFDFIFTELSQKYYLYFGILSLLCMLVCAMGSFGNFKRLKLYYLAYLALGFALVHLLMIQKILTLNYLLVAVGILMLLGYKFIKHFKNYKLKR